MTWRRYFVLRWGSFEALIWIVVIHIVERILDLIESGYLSEKWANRVLDQLDRLDAFRDLRRERLQTILRAR
jgi:hypothetical protein